MFEGPGMLANVSFELLSCHKQVLHLPQLDAILLSPRLWPRYEVLQLPILPAMDRESCH